MVESQPIQRILPGVVGGLLYRRPVFFVRNFDWNPFFNSSQSDSLPRPNVENDLPDAVRPRDRMRGRLLGGDAFEHFGDGRPVPRRAFERSLQLVLDSFDLAHG